MRRQKQTTVKTVNIKDVVTFAKKAINSGTSPKDVLAEVTNLFFNPSNIRVIFDTSEDVNIIYQTDEATPADRADNVSVSIVAPDLPTKNEKVTESPTGPVKRIVLVCDRSSRNHEIELASECNGIVIDMNTWNILSYPPAALSFNMNPVKIKENLSAGVYKIYRADFGTIVTLYYYKNRWVLSTANSYEIDDKIWSGDKTFRQLIDEIFQIYDINIDELNKHWCYSFGFHHNEYHPFNGAGQQPKRAWFVRAVNVEKFNSAGEFTCAEHNIIMNKIPMQHDAKELNKDSIIDSSGVYSRIITQCEDSLPNYITNKNKMPCYGFILISNKPEIVANVLIESKLQMRLRQLICRRPPSDVPINKRFMWWMINATFNETDKPIFRALFPQTEDYGIKLDGTIRAIASRVVEVSQKDNFKFDETPVDKIAKFAIEKMTEKKILINRKPVSIGIVQDFLMCSSFANVYSIIL
jgi:hypothetical protein